MRFLLQHRSDVAASASPYRLVEQDSGEILWANRFLDLQRVRGLNEFSLRYYGNLLLHFIRWWAPQPGVDVKRLEAHSFTESTLLDYVRVQRDELPKLSPETINSRSARSGACSAFTFRRRCRMVLAGYSAPGGHHPADVIAEGGAQ